MVDAVEKFDAISGYEYAITDNSVLGKPYMIWKSLATYTETADTVSREHPIYHFMYLFRKCIQTIE